MSFEDFLIELLSYQREPFIRAGQECFNELYEVRPDIANKIRATDDDCFYVDGRIKKFLLKVKELW